MNVDNEEIQKFEDMAAQWWEPDGPFKPLHEMNPLRLKFIQQHCHLAQAAVLDIGCGGGILAEGLAKAGATVSAIDLAKGPLNVAKLHRLESKLDIDYQLMSAEDLAADKPASFDVVTCLEMLEHVPEPASIIKACFSLCKPGGYVFFSTVNRNLKAYLFAILGAEYIAKMLPKGTHDYQKFIQPQELCQLARNAGLAPIDSAGISYNALTREFHLSDNVDVNYLLALQKP